MIQQPVTAPIHLYESTQLVARIVPDLPKGSPKNIALPMLEAFKARRFFSVEHGFVPVEKDAVPILMRIHCDGELTERGGRGPKLFEVCTAQEAAAIIADEQRRVLLSNAGGSLLHAELKLLTEAHGTELNAQLLARLDAQQVEAATAKEDLAAAVANAAHAEAETADLKSRLAALEALFHGAAPGRAAPPDPPLSNDLAASIREAEAREVALAASAIQAPVAPSAPPPPAARPSRAPRAPRRSPATKKAP